MLALLLAPIEAEGMTVGQRVVAEIDALVAARATFWLIYAFAIGLAVWAAIRGLAIGARWVRRHLPEQEVRIARITAASQVLTVLAGAVAALIPPLRLAPLVVTASLLLLSWAASRVAARQLRNLLAGLALSRRRVFQEGDSLVLGDRRGTVRTIGLWRTKLVLDDGSTTWMPNHDLAQGDITVGGVAGAARVRVEIPVSTSPSPDTLAAIRTMLAATPYRLPGGTITVRAGTALSVELETWASRDAGAIGRRLSSRIATLLDPPVVPPPAVAPTPTEVAS